MGFAYEPDACLVANPADLRRNDRVADACRTRQRRARGRCTSISAVARLVIYRDHARDELPPHAPRATQPAILALADPFRLTAHADLFSYNLMWADAGVRWREPPSTEGEVARRMVEDNVLRADPHRECMLE
jgi:hypothetical protein